MTETCNAIVDLLGCGYEYLSAAAGGKAIYRRWKMLARQGENAGFRPLVVYASEHLLDALLTNLKQAGVTSCLEYRAKLLPVAERTDAFGLLQAWLNLGLAGQDPIGLLGDFVPVRAPEGEDSLCLSCRNHARELLILKCPTQNAWELPLFLPMGGFGDCPAPNEQAAVFRFWQEHYGATPVVAAWDVWELYVERPPMQLLEAERLAMQQFAFDRDLVLQAHRNDGDSIRALASHLLGAKAWYFWWQ